MGKRKDWSSVVAPPQAEPATRTDQFLLTVKERAIREAFGKLDAINTFNSIAAATKFSRSYISIQMRERFKDKPAAMWKIGDDWRVPRATAELWIRELFERDSNV